MSVSVIYVYKECTCFQRQEGEHKHLKGKKREVCKKMVKPAFVDKDGVKKGAWNEEEDYKLRAYIQRFGHWNWGLLPKYAGNSCFFFPF